MTEDRIYRDIMDRNNVRYVTMDVYQADMAKIRSQVDLLNKSLEDLRSEVRLQGDRLLQLLERNMEQMQKLYEEVARSRNGLLRETIKVKDREQSRTLRYVLQYELLKGGFAGLIVGAILLMARLLFRV